MKVLMISTDRNVFQEGSETRNRMIEYGTIADELHIVVFTTRTTNREPRTANQKISENVWIYPTHSFSRWFYITDAYQITRRIIRDSLLVTPHSLITAQDPFETGFTGWLAARKFGIPLQLQIHTDFLSPYFMCASLLNRVRVLIAKFLLPRAFCIRVVSERIRRSLKAKSCKLKTDPVILPVFVDVRKTKNDLVRANLHKKYPQFNFIMLMASRLTKEKNISLAIDAMREVVKQYPKTGLVIVGNGPEEKTLKAKSYKLKDNIVFEPWTDDLASYYKTADVFLLTSNYEGYGRTVVEAQAAGLPVIMTDVGIAGEIIKHGQNGLVVPVGDAQALTEAILCVVERNTMLVSSLPPFPAKEEYLLRCKASWSIQTEIAKRLLICTQKMDRNDAILGFFHQWVEEFAKRCEQVMVICLEEGKHDLPRNVTVYSLGKERGVASRVIYALRFRKLIKLYSDKYDIVFVHMNPEYVVLGGTFWRRHRKKVGLWYVHKSITVWLRLALPLADVVFTAAQESFLLESPKVCVVGHGVDIGRYAGTLVPVHSPPQLVSVGRIAPIKRLEVIIQAIKILKDKGVLTHLTFVGTSVVSEDRGYEKYLQSLAHTLRLEDNVSFRGSVLHDAMPDEYRKYDISINMAPTGGIDKAVLESIAAGLIVVVANEAFARYFGKYASKLMCPASPENLADRVQTLLNDNETTGMRRLLRESVQKNASLESIIGAVIQNMNSKV